MGATSRQMIPARLTAGAHRARDGVMVPLGVTVGGRELAWPTAEVADASLEMVTFRLSGDRDTIAPRHGVEMIAGEADIVRDGEMTLVRARRA